jgi:hypothetical protein
MERYIFVCFKRLQIVALQKSTFVTLGYNTILYVSHDQFFFIKLRNIKTAEPSDRAV